MSGGLLQGWSPREWFARSEVIEVILGGVVLLRCFPVLRQFGHGQCLIDFVHRQFLLPLIFRNVVERYLIFINLLNFGLGNRRCVGSSSSSLEHLFQATFETVTALLFRNDDWLLLWLVLLFILVTEDGCSLPNNLAANAKVLLLRFFFLLLITEDGCSLHYLALNSEVFRLPNLLFVVLVAKWRCFDTWWWLLLRNCICFVRLLHFFLLENG